MTECKICGESMIVPDYLENTGICNLCAQDKVKDLTRENADLKAKLAQAQAEQATMRSQLARALDEREAMRAELGKVEAAMKKESK